MWDVLRVALQSGQFQGMLGLRRWAASAGALLTVLAAVLVGSSLVSSAEQVVLSSAPAEFTVPSGAVLTDVRGTPVEEFSRASSPSGEVLRLPVLDPGRYFVLAPSGSVSGVHAPSVSSLVVSADVLDPDSVPGTWLSFAWAGLLVLLGCAAGAASGVLRVGFAAATLAGLVAWVVTGAASLAVLPILGFALALLAFLIVVFFAPRQGRRQRAAVGLLAGAAMGVSVGLSAVSVLVCAAVALLAAAALLLRSRTPALVSAGAAVVLLSGALVAPSAASASVEPVQVSGSQCESLIVQGSEQEGLECFRALAARIGANVPASEASSRVLTIAESVQQLDPTQVCRQMGEAMSSAAARWGPDRDDPRRLFVDLDPVCDYSSMHGIAPGVFLRANSDGLSDAIVALCSDSTPDEQQLADYEYKAQCWQGTGIMLARKFNFDPALFDICARAPREGIMNCSDGVFRELTDQLARSTDSSGSGFVPDGLTVASLCRDLSGELIGGCYRYVGEEAEARGNTQDKEVGAQAVFDVCRSGLPAEHDKYCWYAVGMITVRAYPSLKSNAALREADEFCRQAPVGEPMSECYVGATNAVLNRDRQDADIEAVCLWFPEEDRARLCENARFYYGHLLGADSSDFK